MIRILTDSTADFSMADAAALGVAVVPLTVSFGDAHYQDGIDLPLERFYDMLAAADKLPTTSQPSPELFLSHFLAAKAAGELPSPAACWASSPCFLWTPAASWAWWTKPAACPAHMSPFLKESTGAAALMKHGPS